MIQHFCHECASQTIDDFCPIHPGAIVESIGVRDTDDDRVRAILARVEPEFDNPHYDPNLAELCRSALRGNAEHKAWVLEAVLSALPEWRWLFQLKPSADETVDVAFVDGRAYRRLSNSRTERVLGYSTAARVDAPEGAWAACDAAGKVIGRCA